MSKADLNQCEIVNALRAVGASVFIASQTGEGFSDLVVGWFGKNFLIEVKNPGKHWKLTTAQKIFHEKWKGKIHIVETVDEALKVLGISI